MKSFILSLAFMLICTFSFAINKSKEEGKINFKIEYSIISSTNGFDTCYARICWNVSEYIKDCTEWVEVPCETPIDLEIKELNNI